MAPLRGPNKQKACCTRFFCVFFLFHLGLGEIMYGVCSLEIKHVLGLSS